jgi:RecB family endonuclease NucS
MAIDQSLWKISEKIEKVSQVNLNSEAELEEVLQNNIEILNENWLVIGRQVQTKYNKSIDLLAIDPFGSLIIIELKKSKTPRDIIAQAIDYASWVKDLQADEVSSIFENYCDSYLACEKSLDAAFYDKFNIKLEEENINNSYQIF